MSTPDDNAVCAVCHEERLIVVARDPYDTDTYWCPHCGTLFLGRTTHTAKIWRDKQIRTL